jgi:hypothetical protein
MCKHVTPWKISKLSEFGEAVCAVTSTHTHTHSTTTCAVTRLLMQPGVMYGPCYTHTHTSSNWKECCHLCLWCCLTGTSTTTSVTYKPSTKWNKAKKTVGIETSEPRCSFIRTILTYRAHESKSLSRTSTSHGVWKFQLPSILGTEHGTVRHVRTATASSIGDGC